jgi:serine/threonine protein kinase
MTGRFPRQFGKYVLLKPMAKGGMGEIYLAAGGDVGGFEKLCVIKKVITEKLDRTKSNRFLDEAKVVLRLAHAALVHTFDAGEVGGEFYIAMELVEGKDLREVWNRCVRTRQRIPLDVALHVVRELARALGYVHSYGDLKLVHRDVAPPNMLLSYVGDVKLTDFGLARSVLKQEHTAPGVVFGRAAYLAPEQARGEMADARTDVYTLGIVLWELLTGQQYLQLGGLDPAAALALVRHPRVVAPSTRAPWIIPALDQVTLMALAPDRERRFRSAEELRQALTTVIAEIAPTADSSRVAEFMRSIYGETIAEERTERERFLKDVIPEFRGRGFPRPPPPENEAGDADGSYPGARQTPPPVRAPAVRPEDGDQSGNQRADQRGPDPAATPSAGLDAAQSSEGEDVARPPKTGPVSHERTVTPASPDSGSAVMFGRRFRVAATQLENPVESLYAATDLESRAPVTVHVLRALPEPAALPAWQEAVRTTSGVRHPHLASILDFGSTEEGRPFVAYEPLVGNDLRTTLAREPRLAAGASMRVALQMTRALAAVHAAGVVHGWLRPASVFVSAPGYAVKLFGFATARLYGWEGRDSSGSRFPPGVVEYLAPERLRGAPPDVHTDLYGVGAVLYELLTGVPAHAGTREVLERKKQSPPQSPRLFRPDLPPELEQLLLKLLDPDPQRRPDKAHELEQILAALTRTLSLQEGDTASMTDGQRRRQRREAALRVVGELRNAEKRDPSPSSPGSGPAAGVARALPPPPPGSAPGSDGRPVGGAPAVLGGVEASSGTGPLRLRSQLPPPFDVLTLARQPGRPVASARYPSAKQAGRVAPSLPMLFTSALGPAGAGAAFGLGQSSSSLGVESIGRRGAGDGAGSARRWRRIVTVTLILVGAGALLGVMRLL